MSPWVVVVFVVALGVLTAFIVQAFRQHERSLKLQGRLTGVQLYRLSSRSSQQDESDTEDRKESKS